MNGLKVEYFKTKNTPTIWFTIGCSLFLPCVFFLIYTFRHTHLIPPEGVNPWTQYFNHIFSSVAQMFFPFYLVLSASLNLNIEHKSNSWKKLLILPVNRTSIFLNKGLFLLLQTSFSIVVFFAAILLSGSITGAIHPELKFLEYSPDFVYYLSLLVRLLIASLGILAIHYVISVFSKNMITPISIGVVCSITGMIIAKGWEYAAYVPYSAPSSLWLSINKEINISEWAGLTISEWSSLAIATIAITIGCWLFNRKEIK